MPDKSTPNPSESGSTEKGSSANPAPGEDKPRIKLKRLVLKDLKINPHINPDAAPVPHAEPVSEPDPEPVVKDLSAETISRIPRPEVEKPLRPLKTNLSDKPDSQEEARVANQGKQAPTPDPAAKPQSEPKSERKASKPKAPAKGKGMKRLLPLLLILGSLGYGIHILFDPLGLKPEPIVPVEIPLPAPPAPESTVSEPLPPPPSIEITRDFTDGSAVDVSDYLNKLARQDLKLSNQPRGIYINQVFFAEGMSLNPSIGLTLDSIETGSGSPSFTVVNQKGETFTIPIP